ALIERLVERGASAAEPGDGDAWRHDGELRALFTAVGTVQLGTWRLVPASERAWIHLTGKRAAIRAAARVIDLHDGTFLAVTDTRHVVRLNTAQLAPLDAELAPLQEWRVRFFGGAACAHITEQRIDEIPVVAHSLVDLLSRALSGDQRLVPLATLF